MVRVTAVGDDISMLQDVRKLGQSLGDVKSAGRYNMTMRGRSRVFCEFTEIVDLQQTGTLRSRPGGLFVGAHNR